MYTELVAKLSHYQQLPYKLLQLGHHKPEQVTLAAQTCLKLWEIGGPGCKHRQSRRFLDPTFEADGASPGDPSLLPLVKRLASGESMLSSPDFDPLIRWVARFQCIRLAERSVESIHSLMTRSLKRAPHGGAPYLSFELRFKQFWDNMIADPKAT